MATISPPRPGPPGRAPGASPVPPPAPRPSRRWDRPGAQAAAADDIATLCLLLVTMAVGVGFVRIFTTSTFVPYVVGAAVLAHGSAWLLRRLDVGLTVASAVASLGSAVIAVWIVLPTETTFGILTPRTVEVVTDELAAARAVFHESVAPVAPLPGFLLAACFGVALVAYLADWAAFRMRATFEAVVPAFALFLVTALWGSSAHRNETVAVLGATALAFLVVQRAGLDAERGAWFSGSGDGAMRSLLTTGAVVGGTALVGGLLLGPNLPWADAEAVYSPLGDRSAGKGNRSRSTISPLVDIQPRILNQSDAPVFQVQATRDSYWRLTSLDSYDGTIWSSNERYRSVETELDESTGLVGATLEQDFTISSLSSIWLPAAYQPQKITGIDDISYSNRSGSLISQEDTSDNLTYHVTSVVAQPSPEALRAATTGSAGGLGDDLARYTARPEVSQRVLGLTQALTAGRTTAYDKVLAIQNHLRTFTYDDRIGLGHSRDALTTFLLNTKRGYCQQFSAALAVMARLLGIPSRVAVGFRPGQAGADGTFQVRNRDAHAWPEIYFDRIGWIAFEPTPNSRNGLSQGNPNGAHTGVPYSRDTGAAGPNTPGTGPGTGAPTTTAAPTTPTTLPEDEPTQAAPEQVGDDASSLRTVVYAFVGLLAVAAAVGLVVGSSYAVAEGRRKRRRRAAGDPGARVALAWLETEEALRLSRVTRRSTTTVHEWLERLGRPAGGAASAGIERGTPGHDALVRLGDAVIDAAYGPSIDERTADRAETDSRRVVHAVHDAVGTAVVLRWRLDPRPALAERRAARLAGRTPVAPKQPQPG